MSTSVPLAPHHGRIDGEHRPLPASSVVELINTRIRETPRTVALEYRGQQITYEALGQLAAAVAETLVDLGVQPGDRVGLWADRSPAVVAAALGAMQAGAAYVPLDPTYPPERIQGILDSAAPVALAFDGGARERPPVSHAQPIDVAGIETPSKRLKARVPAGHDAAYIVFTSGSTGVPKGVVVEHRSLVNYACWCAAMVGDAGSGSPLFASLGFDHAATCLWVPLIQGKRVVLVPGLWEADRIFDDRRGRHTFLKITPSHVRFFERLLQPDYGNATHLVMFGGEALDPKLVSRLGARLAGARLVNHYGPTEATVGCCWHEFTVPDVDGLPTVPIGTPIWNSRAYVVDDDLATVKPGQEGELVLAGHCVARGYLHDEDAGRFIDEGALADGARDTAYRTGDIVERLPNGALLYRGRNDNQVKISGHRVELDELRRHVVSTPGVAEVAFHVVRDGGLDAVEAFVVPTDDGGDGARIPAAVAQAVERHLLSAVTIKAVHVVDELLFDAHGKCDIAATRRFMRGRGA